MKVTVNQLSLNKALGIVARAVPNRSVIPAIQSIRLDTSKGELRLSATDLTIFLSARLDAQVTESDSILVPAKILTGLVETYPNTDVSLTTDNKGKVNVRCHKNDSRISIQPVDDFPADPVVDGDSMVVDAALLKAALGRTIFCAAQDETRLILNSVLFQFEPDKLTLTSLDSVRISRCTLPVVGSSTCSAVLPLRSAAELVRLLDDECYVRLTDKQIAFTLGPVCLTSQLLSGDYMDVSRLFTLQFPHTLRVRRDELAAAIRPAMVFGRDHENTVTFSISTDKLVIHAAATTGAGEQELPAECDVETNIMFNGKFVQDFLASGDQEDAVLQFNTGKEIARWGFAGDDSYTHMIFPRLPKEKTDGQGE